MLFRLLVWIGGYLCISLGVNLTLSIVLSYINKSSKLRQRDVDRVAGFSKISHVTAWTSVGHPCTMMAIKSGDLIYQMSECRRGNDALLLRKLEFEVV